MAQTIFTDAMQTAAVIVMPAVALVACIGVAVGIVQTLFQVQDQNVSFFPKLVAVAWSAATLGPVALGLLVNLFTEIIRSLPALAHA